MKTTTTTAAKSSLSKNPLTQTKAFARLSAKLRAGCADDRLRKLALNFVPNVNLNELCEATGLGKSTVCRILQGSRHKNTYTLLLVATALNISLEDFIYILELRKAEADKIKKQKPKEVIFHGK